jgi:hypothetical protein
MLRLTFIMGHKTTEMKVIVSINVSIIIIIIIIIIINFGIIDMSYELLHVNFIGFILTFVCPCIASVSLRYYKYIPRFLDIFISINCSTCFRRFLRPSSVAQNCTYSVRYCQTNTTATVGEITLQIHLIHYSSRQQYWFDNTWHCMYSFVLLMMGGGTAWNM